MRIISGTHKGRSIRPPKNLPVRPTTDKAKEGLFNILNNRVDFEDLAVLDLFCGTGNISLEFASRGASSITSVDQNYRCVSFVKSASQELGLDAVKTQRADALKFVESTVQKFDLVFADPPYDFPKYSDLIHSIIDRNLLKEGGVLIVEHPAEVDLTGFSELYETRKYGRVHFSFFQLEA